MPSRESCENRVLVPAGDPLFLPGHSGSQTSEFGPDRNGTNPSGFRRRSPAFRLSSSMLIWLSIWPEAVTTCIRATGDPSSVIRDSSSNRRKAVTALDHRDRPAPTSQISGTRSKTVTAIPTFRSATAAASRRCHRQSGWLWVLSFPPSEALPSRHHREQLRFREPARWARHWRRTFVPRDPLRFKIHRSTIAPIHVEGHGRVIADDSPSPACLPKAHRRAKPHVLVFTALAPAHSVER